MHIGDRVGFQPVSWSVYFGNVVKIDDNYVWVKFSNSGDPIQLQRSEVYLASEYLARNPNPYERGAQ
jgi:hypothetical protein